MGDHILEPSCVDSVIEAAEAGSAARCAELLAEARVKISEPVDGMQRTLLHIASMNGKKRAVQTLVESGGDVHAVDSYGRTPLHWASENGHLEVMRALLAAGAEAETVGNSAGPPLLCASAAGQVEAMRLLLQAGANVASQDWIDRSPLELASEWGKTRAVRLLLDAGADPRALGGYGKPPLHRASWSGQLRTMWLLLAAGAEPRPLLVEPYGLPCNVWVLLTETELWQSDGRAVPTIKRFRRALCTNGRKMSKRLRWDLVATRRLRDLLRPLVDPRVNDKKELQKRRAKMFQWSPLRQLPWRVMVMVLGFLIAAPVKKEWNKR